MDILYAMEKYGTAVDALATGAGRVKERLLNAAITACIAASWMPDTDWFDVKDDIQRLWSTLTAHKAKGTEGDFAVSIDALTEYQAVDVARLFVEIDAKLQDMYKETKK